MVMAGAGAVVETDGVDLQNPSWEGMVGAGPPNPPLPPLLLIVHRIQIAKQQRHCLHALVKRKEMEGVDLHEICLEGMVGVGPPHAHQCLARMMRMSKKKEMEGADLHKEQKQPSQSCLTWSRPKLWICKIARFATLCVLHAWIVVIHRKESATSAGTATTGMTTSLKAMMRIAML